MTRPCRSSSGLQIICKDEAVIPMGSITHLDFKVGLNHQEISTWKEDELVKLDFNLTNENSWALSLVNVSLEFSLEDILWSRTKPILVKALVIGVDTLEAVFENHSKRPIFLQLILCASFEAKNGIRIFARFYFGLPKYHLTADFYQNVPHFNIKNTHARKIIK